MVSQKLIKLPDGKKVPNERFVHYFVKSLGELQKYDQAFYQVMESDSTLASPKIQELKPEEAAYKLRFFYEFCDSKEDYEKNMSILREYANRDSLLEIILEVFDERVKLLEKKSSQARPETLKKFRLEYLLQPFSQ